MLTATQGSEENCVEVETRDSSDSTVNVESESEKSLPGHPVM